MLGCGGGAPAATREPPRASPERPSGGKQHPLVGHTERGRASYYADSLAGRLTASGEPYDPGALTAAHRELPFGTWLEVTREDGRQVVVRVTDRGPFGKKERIVDLSRRAAEAIGMIREGVVPVTLRVVAVEEKKKKKKAKKP